MAIQRLRKRFRESIRAEIGQTLSEGDDIDGELRYLAEVVAQGHRSEDQDQARQG